MYSDSHSISEFKNKLTSAPDWNKAPAFVLDMDGNVNIGYNLTNPKLVLPGDKSQPKAQDIPDGANIGELIANGTVVPDLFAKKGMDVRLPPELVATLNERIEAGDRFSISFLTSRAYDDAKQILRESGIVHPDKVTLVSDSGNTVQINGVKHSVRKLSDHERGFLGEVDTICARLNEEVKAYAVSKGFDPEKVKPLTVENKATARNIHFRETLSSLGVEEDSEIAQHIDGLVKGEMERLVGRGDAPKDSPDGPKVFSLTPGQMTYEVKIAKITKADGLKAITEAMLADGRKPEHIVFSGDDVFKWEAVPGSDGALRHTGVGTDQPAMVFVKEKLKSDYGIDGLVVHTHHPLRSSLLPPASEEEIKLSQSPDPLKAIPDSSPLHPGKPGGIDIVVPTPVDNARLVVDTVRGLETKLGAAMPAPITRLTGDDYEVHSGTVRGEEVPVKKEGRTVG